MQHNGLIFLISCGIITIEGAYPVFGNFPAYTIINTVVITMESDAKQIISRVYKAKNDSHAADDLIESYLPFIRSEAAKILKRRVLRGYKKLLTSARFIPEIRRASDKKPPHRLLPQRKTQPRSYFP